MDHRATRYGEPAVAYWRGQNSTQTVNRLVYYLLIADGPYLRLGDFMRFTRMYNVVNFEMRGIVWLMVESYARYAVQGMIRCPRSDCSAAYIERKSWRLYLSASGHGHYDIRRQYEELREQLFCYKHTPSIERLAIEARHRRTQALRLEVEKVQRRVGHDWGPRGSEQRMLFEEEFKAQMRDESLYAPADPGSSEMSPAEQYMIDFSI